MLLKIIFNEISAFNEFRRLLSTALRYSILSLCHLVVLFLDEVLSRRNERALELLETSVEST